MEDIFDGKEIKTPNTNSALPLDINFVPNNPMTYQGNVQSIHPDEANENKKPFEIGIKENPYHAGVFETAKAEFKSTSTLVNDANKFDQLLQDQNPMDDVVPTNWKPTDDMSAFNGITSKYLSFIMGSSGPKDQRKRYNHVLDLQANDKLIDNGSVLGMLLGGFAGASPLGSPESIIPIAGQVKYARYAPTILNSMARAVPGVALGSAAYNANINATKDAGNLENFVVNTFADTVFGTVFSGAIAGASRVIDSGALWDLRKTLNPIYHGIDFKVKVNPEGEFKGYQAVDTTGSLSAAQVNYAQDFADSTFAKTGLFKIPYFGEGALKFFGVFNPLVRMINSPYQSVRGFADRTADHSFITEGNLQGKAAPQRFENLMNQLSGSNRSIYSQIDGLHLVRNGLDIGLRATNPLKKVTAHFTKNDYISKEQFGSEIRNVIINGNPSEHGAVNEAASLLRTSMDESYKAYRKAYDLPEDWLPPKTAEGYLMRVYDTPYMTLHENEWKDVISGYLKQADQEIETHLQPIRELESHIKLANKQEVPLLKSRLNSLQESLQNEIRANPDLRIHAEDWRALSANEAKEIQTLTKPIEDIQKLIEEQKKVISSFKKVKGENNKAALDMERSKLKELEDSHFQEEEKIQERIHSGEIKNNLYDRIPGSQRYKLKDVNNRLKFREVHESDYHRQQAAKAYYDTIMNQTPEQTINQVLGKLTGESRADPTYQRTLLVPDKILYENNFLSNDIGSNVINYRNVLGRRTFLKTVFNDLSVEGDIQPIIENVNKEHQSFREPLNNKLAEIKEERKNPEADQKLLDEQEKKVKKALAKESSRFNTAIEQMNLTYSKMMGHKVGSKTAEKYKSMIMSYTAAIRLGFVPFSMLSDLGGNILQHGMWPFIRDGLIPSIESLGGALKTKDSEALRNAAPHVHLALQDVLMGYADKNFGGQSQPYINMGNKVANGLENIAHLSSNLAGTNYFENGLQHITASIMQSKVMKSMVDFKKGELSKKDLQGLLKYSLDPKEWSDRFIAAFEKNGADKTKLGGYQSNFWKWDDLEASNKMSDTVFRGVKDTVIQRGMLDAPFFMDNPLGAIIMGFKGWTFASLTRYVIPAMQQADGQKLMGISFMLAMGALVSPTRRIASGKDPYPDDATPQQIFWAAFQDSGFFSFFGDVLSDMNLISGGTLLGSLKNDRYRDRTMAGVLGPAAGVANDLYSILGSMWSGEVNQADVNKMVRLIPFTQITQFRALSNKLVESLDLPKTRGQARKQAASE